MALRSATECAAILDVCNCLKLLDDKLSSDGIETLDRIVSMLTKMAKNAMGEGAGEGTGEGRGS